MRHKLVIAWGDAESNEMLASAEVYTCVTGDTHIILNVNDGSPSPVQIADIMIDGQVGPIIERFLDQVTRLNSDEDGDVPAGFEAMRDRILAIMKEKGLIK